jgi:hypothetical protein
MNEFELNFHEIRACSTNFCKDLVDRLKNSIGTNKCTVLYIVYCTINTFNSAVVDVDGVCKSFHNVGNEAYGIIIEAIMKAQ